MTAYQWVDDGNRLSTLVSAWQQQPFVVLDTEFVRRRTYYAELGLLQIAVDDGCYLIDPLPIAELGDILRPLLTDPTVEKVFHSGEEDLEILGLLMNEPLQGGVDTQIGWGMVSGDAGVGYARLMSEQLGVDVPKDQTQSNWLLRPLSEKQCQYAINDVQYLYRFYPHLRASLVEQGRLDWVREDVDRQARKILDRQDHQYYLNLRQAWKLTGNRLWLLQQLAERREQRCQILNVNRKALISDPDLVTLAQKRPKDIAAISALTDIRPSVLRHEGEWIEALIAQSQEVTSDQYPAPIPAPLPREWTDDFQSVRARVRQIAQEFKLPPEYLARKKDLEALVKAAHDGNWGDWPESWYGWRRAVFAEAVEAALKARLAREVT